MNNAIFRKTMESVRNRIRHITLTTTKTKRNYLVSEPNYYTTKTFSEYLLAIERKITQIFMKKNCLLTSVITENEYKTVMYEFWYDYVKLKYKETAKLCYMDTNSFIVCIKTEDV